MDQCDWGGDYDDLHANGVSAYFIGTRCDDGGLRLRLVLRSLPRSPHVAQQRVQLSAHVKFLAKCLVNTTTSGFQLGVIFVFVENTIATGVVGVSMAPAERTLAVALRASFRFVCRLLLGGGARQISLGVVPLAGHCTPATATFQLELGRRVARCCYRLWPRGHCNSATRIGPEQTNSRWWIDHLPPGPE